jgi:hypothetical protein
MSCVSKSAVKCIMIVLFVCKLCDNVYESIVSKRFFFFSR